MAISSILVFMQWLVKASNYKQRLEITQFWKSQ